MPVVGGCGFPIRFEQLGQEGVGFLGLLAKRTTIAARLPTWQPCFRNSGAFLHIVKERLQDVKSLALGEFPVPLLSCHVTGALLHALL